MKKNIRLIIICALVVIILAAALIILTTTGTTSDNNDDNPASSAADEVTTSLLYSNKMDDLAVLTIENEHGTYKVERVEFEGENLWTIKEIANLPLSNTVISALIENAISVTAQQTVAENPEDISIYGLDKPLATVTAEFTNSDKTVRKLYVGNKTPKGTAHYFMMEGDPAVYTVNVGEMSPYLNDKWYAVVKTVFQSSGETVISKMTVSRPDIDYDIVIEYDKRLDDENNMVANSSLYVMTSPVFRELNPETCDAVTNGVFGLTATELGIVNPNQEDMVTCGITEPSAVLTVETTDGNKLHLSIGNEIINESGNKGRFVYVEGISIIYVFDNSLLPWLTVKPLDITTTMFTSNYVYDLTSIDITTENGKYDFEITGSNADDFAVTLDGQATDPDAFKNFYQFILRAPSTDVYFEETTANPVLTVDIRTTSGRDLIEFIPSDNRQSIIQLNGKVAYKCAAAYVDRFISNMELYKNGEEIVASW